MLTRNCCPGSEWSVWSATQGSQVTACGHLASTHNSEPSSATPALNALMSGLRGKHFFSSLDTLIFVGETLPARSAFGDSQRVSVFMTLRIPISESVC